MSNINQIGGRAMSNSMENNTEDVRQLLPDESKDTRLQRTLRNLWHDNFNEAEFIEEAEAIFQQEAKQALYQLLLDDLIGGDEDFIDYGDTFKKNYFRGRDSIRQELRTKLKQLMEVE